MAASKINRDIGDAMDKSKRQDARLRGVWLDRVTRAEKAREKFRTLAKRAWNVYRIKESSTEAGAYPKPMFPIWWSTVQVERSALFARMPIPDVRPRYPNTPDLPQQQPQPMPGAQPEIAQAMQQQAEQQAQAMAAQKEYQKKLSDVLALVPERLLTFTIDTRDLRTHADRAVTDFLVSGLGVAKWQLETITEAQVDEMGHPLRVDPDDEKSEPMEQVKAQYLCLKYFGWDRFFWDPAATSWEDVDWCAFVHWYTASGIKKEFGVDVGKREGNPSNDAADFNASGRKKGEGGYKVIEIWDKKNKRKIVVADCYADGCLENTPDPLKLQNFWPFAKPLMANLGEDVLDPQSDYAAIADLDASIQRKTDRIHALAAQIKDTGFYDGQLAELAALQSSTDGQLIPIKNLAERLASAGGAKLTFDNVVSRWDNTQAIQTIQVLGAERETDKNQIFETLGIADIVRGASKATETATAQNIKGQWASVRLADKQGAIAQWFRESYRIAAEMGLEHFTDDELYYATGIRLPEELRETLKSDIGRTLLIDVETDATVAIDEQAEREQTTNVVNTIMPLLPIVPQAPDVGKELLLMALRPFKGIRSIVEAIERMPSSQQQAQQMGQQLQQAQAQIQQLQQQLAQAQQEIEKRDAEEDAIETARAQSDIQTARAKDALTLAQTEKTRAETFGAVVRTQREQVTPIRDPNMPRPGAA